MPDWQAIWNRRASTVEADTLQALIDLDGFDSGAGRIEAPDWRTYAAIIANRLSLEPGHSVYEVGCGAGAFLYALDEMGIHGGGLDYSASLIEAARKALPRGDFSVAEARDLPTEPRCDVVLANSVFHYFADLDYAEQVLDRMLAKAKHAIAILELPDLASRDAAEAARRAALSPAEYEEKYRGLQHRYYAREWFFELAAERGLSCETFDQCVPHYQQSAFRFNCVITRAQARTQQTEHQP